MPLPRRALAQGVAALRGRNLPRRAGSRRGGGQRGTPLRQLPRQGPRMERLPGSPPERAVRRPRLLPDTHRRVPPPEPLYAGLPLQPLPAPQLLRLPPEERAQRERPDARRLLGNRPHLPRARRRPGLHAAARQHPARRGALRADSPPHGTDGSRPRKSQALQRRLQRVDTRAEPQAEFLPGAGDEASPAAPVAHGRDYAAPPPAPENPAGTLFSPPGHKIFLTPLARLSPTA